MHQKRRGGNFVATVLVGERGGLFDGREMLRGRRCVNVTHLDAWRGRRLDVALRWEENSPTLAEFHSFCTTSCRYTLFLIPVTFQHRAN